MQQDERIGGALQENLLTLLCFDDKNCKLLRASLTPRLFESAINREVAGHAIDFIDQYGEAIKEHLPDQLEEVLNGDDKRKASAYKRLLENLFQSRDSVNAEYVLQQLHKFVRMQNFKSMLVQAVQEVEGGNIDAAESIVEKGMKGQAVAFEPGLSLSNVDDIAALMDDPEEEGFELGIPELDQQGNFPRRKELTMLMAARGRGKSWFITHCAKQALLQRYSVLIVTLEMGEKSYARRFLQSFFSISKRESTVKVTRFMKDKNGDLSDLVMDEVERLTMRDENIRSKLITKAKREFARRKPFRIKAFPSGQLTMQMLKAYLEGLERFEKFVPDVIMVDYPDLFQLDNKNLRIDLGQIVVGLRGLGVERNAAMVIVSQGNREAEKATTVTGDMAAEDISKLATADLALTYSQTPGEYGLGLARVLVEKSRNEAGKYSVLMSQAYAMGQFCLDSVRMPGDYFEMMKDRSERKGRRRRDEEDDE